MIYFYKAYYNDGSKPEVIATNFPVRRPKSIATECIKVKPSNILAYFWYKISNRA